MCTSAHHLIIVHCYTEIIGGKKINTCHKILHLFILRKDTILQIDTLSIWPVSLERDDVPVVIVQKHFNLGVLMYASYLKFGTHIKHIVCKANNKLFGLIKNYIDI